MGLHVEVDDLNLFMRGRLDVVHSAEIEAHLRDCESCGEKLTDEAKLVVQLATLSRQMEIADATEKRRAHRIPTDTPALVRILSPFCADRFPARVLDVSKHGLRMCFARALLPGTVVQLHVKPLHILGEVRYSISADSGEATFLIGVEIEDVHGW